MMIELFGASTVASDAVALFDAYAKGGDNPQLKGWAGKTLPHLKEHLTMVEKLK
jgi:putative membrane protein